MLVERVLILLNFFGLSKAACARVFNVSQKTFNDHLTEKNEDRIWPYLPKFLEMYPRVSRQWLYFGEGPMLIGHGAPLDEPVPLPVIIEAVEAMAKDAGGTNAALLRTIAGLPLEEGGKAANSAITEENAQLKDEIRLLQAKLLKAQEVIIAMHTERAGRRSPDSNAHGANTAVPLGLHGNELQQVGGQ